MFHHMKQLKVSYLNNLLWHLPTHVENEFPLMQDGDCHSGAANDSSLLACYTLLIGI
jgi:hypothetical protein